MMDIHTPPCWLDRYGKAYWHRVTPILSDLGKLDPLTYDLIASGCQAYSTYREALITLKKEGRIITAHTGAKKTHPALAVEKQAFEMLCRVWKELDIRGKPPIPQTDELDAFIEEGK